LILKTAGNALVVEFPAVLLYNSGMNNLQTIREFFQLGTTEVSTALQLSPDELRAYESGEKQPEILMWQRFSEYYADKFHVPALPDMVEPIHFRLSVDYLMNIGLTMNDLMAFKWYFDNTRPEIGEFTIALYEPGTTKIERRTTDLPTVLDEYAGYILLNNDGSLNQFIDERNNDKISDWRLLLYKNDNFMVDVTPDLMYFEYLVNMTVM
jgi:hypothetical protein